MATKKRSTAPPKPPPKPSGPPLVLYVIKGAEQSYFGYADFDGFDHGDKVAVYELREVRTLHVTRGLR